jgi:hypothetical protein
MANCKPVNLLQATMITRCHGQFHETDYKAYIQVLQDQCDPVLGKVTQIFPNLIENIVKLTKNQNLVYMLVVFRKFLQTFHSLWSHCNQD